MRKFLLSLMIIGFVFTIGYGQDPVMYIDFEDVTPTFSGSLWGGVMDNPLKDAVNGSDSVGLGKTGNNSWDGFTYYFPGKLDLRDVKEFKMKVYHPTLQGETRLQFEPGGVKLDVMYTTPGQWAELTWTLPEDKDGTFERVLLCFAHERAVADEEWYFDDLQGAPTYMAVGPNTYYSTETKRKEWSPFQAAASEGVVENPSPDGLNDNPYAGKALTGSDTWSGMYYDLPGPIDFSGDKKFQMKVYSDSVGNARIQLEGSGATTMKLSVPYTTPGKWAHLEFDASAVDTSMDYTRLVLIFDDKDAEAGEEWYFDNITGPWLDLGEIEPVHDYLSFDDGILPDPPISSFSGALFGGIAENPLKDDVNGSDSVGVFYTGSVGWAASQYWLPSYVDFSEGYTFTLKVYNADSTGSVRFWMEDEIASKKIKVQQDYTTPGAWQKITFDVRNSIEAAPANNLYRKMLICMDDKDVDVGEEWFFDELMGPALNAVYYSDASFNIIEEAHSASKVEIVINNDDNKLALAEVGDTIWVLDVPLLPTGDHVMDLYVDDELVEDDVAFTIAESIFPTEVTYTYVPEIKVDALFTVTVTGTSSTDFAVDINNGGSPIALYDDGTHGDATADDGIWSVLVEDLPAGDHVMDLYDGGTLVATADNVAFSLAESSDPVVVAYTYTVTDIQELKMMGFNIYPNPAQEFVTISANSDNLDNIRIYNLQGKEMMRLESINATELTIDVSDMKSGVYYLRIEGDKDNHATSKMVIK